MASISNILTNDQLRIERNRYEQLVHSEFMSIDYNTDIHKKVSSFIYITLLLGFFFMWCGASESSNIYIFLERYINKSYINIFFTIVIMVLLLIPVISIVFSDNNIREKIKTETLLEYSTQNKIFKKFIINQVKIKERIEIKNIQDAYNNIIKNNNIEDYRFKTSDFVEYLLTYTDENYRKLPKTFLNDLANLILINECIENTLVQTKEEINREFTLILQDNLTLI